ncbi:MAG: NAD(P)H-hydrate dehydratase [Lachnospiraceae bacterium]|nr:NAD(P)H-hydrate dehydratase [Lachnospiraceae bacterium]
MNPIGNNLTKKRPLKERDAELDAMFFAQTEKYEGIVTHFSSEDEVALPERYTWSNKGSYGKLLIIAANRGCSGAGYLTAHSAFMAGCGMVKVLTCEDTARLLNQMQPEAMTGILFAEDGGFDGEVLEAGLDWADTILIGPGLGTGEAAKEVLRKVLAAGKKAVVDADALNIIAETVTCQDRKERAAAIAKLFTAPAVLTPHIGELSRLTGLETAELKACIFDTAYEYTYNNILTYVCKDARTVIASGGHLHYNTNGNSGMATAGSGDVLAGLIAGLMAAGLEPYEAARSGVYIHAAAGDEAAEKSCEDCITAGDIANNLPVCISRLRKR